MIKNFKLTIFILVLALGVQAQKDSSANESDELSIEDTLSNVFRPRLAYHMGILSYFGEIQNDQKGLNGLTGRIAYGASVSAPLTRYLRLEFSFMFGQVSANERGLYRNLNFKSRIRSGGISLHYNFYPLIPQKINRYFSPIIGIGLNGFEFLSKTDQKDKYGNTYHYWSDGSIRDLPENSPNAELANRIKRDYTFETDLREQNLDGLGKYREQSFAIPLTFALEFHITPRVDFRVGTIWNLTFTDLIDNFSSRGEGVRKGDKSNDQLLYTNFSISYDLVFEKQRKAGRPILDEPKFKLREMVITDSSDNDNDGTLDILDDCLQTPLVAQVDSTGCPVDNDQDGVPDYRDDEPYFTSEDVLVDENGVTLTQADLDLRWNKFQDSTGEYVDYINQFTSVQYNGNAKKKINNRRKILKNEYVVVVGKKHKNVSANDLHKYLGYKNFETIVRDDTVYYVVANYDNIADAVAAKSSLDDKGIDVKEVSKVKEGVDRIFKIDDKVVDKVESVNKKEGKTIDIEKENQGVQYRVQIGAFSKIVDENEVFPGINNIIYTTAKDGLTRYYTGNTKDIEMAVRVKNNMQAEGYSSSFVVAYKNGKRVTLKEAGVATTGTYSEENELNTFTESELPVEKTKNSNITFRVQVGEFQSDVPIKTLDMYQEIGGISPQELADGTIIYYTGQIETLEEAETKKQELINKGLKKSIIIGDDAGKIISKEKAIELK